MYRYESMNAYKRNKMNVRRAWMWHCPYRLVLPLCFCYIFPNFSFFFPNLRFSYSTIIILFFVLQHILLPAVHLIYCIVFHPFIPFFTPSSFYSTTPIVFYFHSSSSSLHRFSASSSSKLSFFLIRFHFLRNPPPFTFKICYIWLKLIVEHN